MSVEGVSRIRDISIVDRYAELLTEDRRTNCLTKGPDWQVVILVVLDHMVTPRHKIPRIDTSQSNQCVGRHWGNVTFGNVRN
jgi:hypothetical protein